MHDGPPVAWPFCCGTGRRSQQPRAQALPAARHPRVRLWSVALSDLKRVVQLEAKQPRAYYVMGRLHLLAGDRDQAIEALTQAIDTAAEDQTELLAEALTLRGRIQTSSEQGRADLDRALTLVPDRTEALLAPARVLQEQ